ncbi:MAG: TrkH family potassium uptake protein [Methanomicrobiales archaeon]|nr:TrkH family potassium uptake protein [Methanomicrobiales archaeon]
MKRIQYLAIIAHDMGEIFRFVSVATMIPLIVLVYYGEWEMIVPMGSVPAVFFILGSLMERLPRQGEIARLSVALVAVALTWLSVALVGSLPYLLGLKLSVTDSIFESMSGWTATGFTMISSLDVAPRTILFWRSFTQWLGGIGVIAFGIAMLSRSGLVQFQLYRSEGRSEAFMPSIVSTGRNMWGIYLVLTFLFTIVVWLISRVPLFDAINLTMTAIATGGFTPKDGGIPQYANPMLEMVLIPVMLAGALPFKIYYYMFRRSFRRVLIQSEMRVLLLLALLGSSLVVFDLVRFGVVPLGEALRTGAFMTVSAITSTGFQNASIHPWPRVTVIIIIMIMLIGGCAGSTAGGIKVNRVVLAYEGLIWWFRRSFTRRTTIIPFKHEGRSIPEKISEVELSKNMLVVILFIIVVFFSTLVCLHFYMPEMKLEEIIFDVVSAIGNNGLGAGYIGPESPLPVKWVFIFVMWAGRLEIVPVIMLFIGIFKGFESRIPK